MKKVHRKHHSHHSEHRDSKKKLQRTLRNGLIHFFVPGLLTLIISIAHKPLIEHLNLWFLRGVTLLVIGWCGVGFLMLLSGILLWLRVKAG